MASNISYWLKERSRWFKNYIFAKKCILIRFWIQILHTLLLCHVLLFGCWIFSIPSRCQTVWIQIRLDILSGLIWVQTNSFGTLLFLQVIASPAGPITFIHDPGPIPRRRRNCLQRLSADIASKELNTKQLVDQYFLAKTLAKVNFIWLQLFTFGLSVSYNNF